MILIANSIVKQSKRQKAGKLYLWILITTYYLLSKNWDIFATHCCILLIFNHNYFRGGEVRQSLYIKNVQLIRAARFFVIEDLGRG